MSPLLRSGAFALLLAAPSGSPPDDADFIDLRFEEVAARRAASGKPWLEFLRSSALYVGDYALARGATDAQSPHADDEVYYVVAGAARFTAGSGAQARTVDAQPGSVLFVKAGVAHHFHDVTEDLDLLVFFSTASPSALREELVALLERYADAYNRRDAAALARVYTEDGLFAPPSGKVVRGRAELEAYWGRALAGAPKLALTLGDFETRAGTGWASGEWTLAGSGSAAARRGRFAIGLRRARDGVWRMSFDCYSEARSESADASADDSGKE